jgi:hypothetical protein
MNTIGVLFTVAVFLTVHTFIMKMFKGVNKVEVKKKFERPAVVNTKLIR